MGLLYYIPARRFPGGKTPDVVKGDALAEFGLAHLAGAALTHRGVRNQGPDGGAGLIIGLGVPSGETGYFKDEQEWHPAEKANLWLGWKTGETPKPNSLLRARAPEAKVDLVMGDGNSWGFAPVGVLRQRITYDAAGEFSFGNMPEYSAHYDASEWFFDFIKGEKEQKYKDVVFRLGVCLGSRYHVSHIEVTALGLLTTDMLREIAYACLGVDVAAEEKKTEAEPEV